MDPDAPETTPRRNWVGFWSMIVQQTQNAFNDKVAQFILIPLGGVVAVHLAVESYAAVLISLPFVLFAPLAGWLSDRFSKRDVMLWAALFQVVALMWISLSLWTRHLPWALGGFFALATQAAFFSPAKFGITKELLGSRHLGFATGIQQMAAMLAMLAGQILAGWLFDERYHALGSQPEQAWWAALGPLLVLTATSVPALAMAVIIPRVPAQGGGKLTARMLVGHFTGLADLWRRPGLRRAGLGVAFFWGFAAFINLWSVKLAKFLTGGGEGFGTLSSGFMAAASLGMAAGFGAAATLQRRRIELGLVPLAGIGMAVMALIIAVIPQTGWMLPAALAALSFTAAIFLAPLNAWLQDNYPADKRGDLQSSVNLQDCLAGILVIGMLELVPALLRLAAVPEGMIYRIEIAGAGLFCAAATWYVIRLLPGDFARVLGLSVVRALYRMRTVHRGRLPDSGGVLLLPNHVTWADAFFISASCGRPVRFVMDEVFMAKPAIRWFVKLFDTVTIRRDQPREAIRVVIDGLRAGDLMCLFPEGQLTRTGVLSRLQRGCELIARKAGHPIIPLWCDGAWGSVFSFERGRFFRKFPYKPLRYGIRSAFGTPLDPKTFTLTELREALNEAAGDAYASRFRSAVWEQRKPDTDTGRWNAFPAERRRQLWLNGYQIGQIHALQRRSTFWLIDDDADTPPAIHAFAALFNSRPIPRHATGHAGTWVGGAETRKTLETKPPDGAVTFYDFSPNSIVPLELPNLTHCPCLAIDGVIIAMSMPDPPCPPYLQDVQTGTKPGSFGKLLPGWFVTRDPGGILRIKGPAAPPEGIPLPAGTVIDDEGYVSRSADPA
ncbi:MAG: MFS transporter [Verrucomicrobia bacterium]|nr:MFS transporter [Verrucomicrobiota bacterium]